MDEYDLLEDIIGGVSMLEIDGGYTKKSYRGREERSRGRGHDRGRGYGRGRGPDRALERSKQQVIKTIMAEAAEIHRRDDRSDRWSEPPVKAPPTPAPLVPPQRETWSQYLKRVLVDLPERLTKQNFPDIVKLFPPTTRPEELVMDHEAAWSISTPAMMKLIIDCIHEYVGSTADFIIVDATANVGGSAIALAGVCREVIAVEISPNTFEMLKNNISLYDCADKIRPVLGNYLEIGAEMKCDLVFVDPPWGGVDYRTEKKNSLFLLDGAGRQVSMEELAKEVVSKTGARWLAIKAPGGYEHEFVSGAVEEKLRSLKLVIVDMAALS